jgi:hypothetical protein
MNIMTTAQAEQQLTHLADQFAHWRQQRTTRSERIPPPLWDHAISLTAILPMAYVAKRLRLRGSDLKKRCAARQDGPCAETTPTPLGFVEVTAASSWPLSPRNTEIELHRADGARLRIRSPEPQLPLAALVRTFLERP